MHVEARLGAHQALQGRPVLRDLSDCNLVRNQQKNRERGSASSDRQDWAQPDPPARALDRPRVTVIVGVDWVRPLSHD
ncbi:MAG TPA: hypothetical protein VFO44_11415 [Steroidobacteraceae bacterium]|nr:hypothetical protein [Steroidobacteraceae bacterium]